MLAQVHAASLVLRAAIRTPVTGQGSDDGDYGQS